MKLHTLFVLGLVIGTAGCAEKSSQESGAMSEPESAAQMPADDTTAKAGMEEAQPDMTEAKIEEWRNVELLDHMHAHAEHLDDLNIALDEGELEAAATPAYWLASHMEIEGLPEGLQPIVANMRDAARDVETAEDLESARAAAERIVSECQGCHVATGYIDEIS